MGLTLYMWYSPATPGGWQSEISWTLTSAENGFLIASGGAPYTPVVGDGTFNVPLPAILSNYIAMMSC